MQQRKLGNNGPLDSLLPKDRRREHPRFSPDNIKRNAELLAPLEKIADLTGAFAPGVSAGTRYPEKQLKALGVC